MNECKGNELNELSDTDLERFAGGGGATGKVKPITCAVACAACSICGSQNLPPSSTAPIDGQGRR